MTPSTMDSVKLTPRHVTEWSKDRENLEACKREARQEYSIKLLAIPHWKL
jgi:hypothetical protein